MGRMSKVLPAVGVTLLACAFTSDAHAAMCIRLFSEPKQPMAGVAARIGLRTFAPLPNGELRPSKVRDYPFRVQAVAPGGRIHRVSIKPSQRNEYAWIGTFLFARKVVWTIRVINFPGYPKGCAEVLRVRVRAAEPA